MALSAGGAANIADLVANPAIFFSIESTAGTTHSLTTVANQRVLVIAKGWVSGDNTVTLAYNAVTKDTVTVGAGVGSESAFCLMYTEIPGAGTQNVTLSTGTNALIVVLKLRVG